MKVALVYPYISHPFPTPYVPLGLGYLASYLRREGIDVTIFDLANTRMSIPALVSEIASMGPDLVGFTVNYPSLPTCIDIARRLKSGRRPPGIVFGGPWPTFLPETILRKVPEVDFVVRNEGEATFHDLVRGAPPDTIEGLTYRSDGGIVSNPDRPLIKDIDSLPSPYLSGAFPLHRYKIATMITTRGCSNRCLFCSAREIFFNKVRFHGVERLSEEIGAAYAAGIREFVMVDDSFFQHVDRASKVLELFARRYTGCAIECQIRFDAINRETVSLLKRAGVYVLNFGLETGNRRTLGLINKGTDPAMIEQALRQTRQAGIKSVVNMIIGLPGEGKKDVRESLEFAGRLDADVFVFHIIRPYPGSDLYRKARDLGFHFIDPEGMHLRRADTSKMSYEEMWEMVEYANARFGDEGFYNKVLTSERIDITHVHPIRCLL